MEAFFCQSCGMPISVPEHFGTNQAGDRNDDYCHFCYQSGQFTADISMDEMIVLCAEFTDEWNTNGERFTKEEAIVLMKNHFPRLKRWAKKKVTESVYHTMVNRVIDYIDRHLMEPIDLDTLAEIAHSSRFHFHRIFRAIMDENAGEYVLRLRLERAAQYLRTTHLLAADIATQSGYQTVQAFSKAFKKYFGVSPSTYRSLPETMAVEHKKTTASYLLPPCELRIIDDLKYVYIRIMDVYGSPKSYNKAWGKLYSFARKKELINEDTKYLGVSFDDPTITASNRCRFYACITTDKDIKPQGEFGVQTIKGGTYAVFTLKGSYRGLTEMYHAIYAHWLPENNYHLRNTCSFELYLNNLEYVCDEDLLTEVYIPVKEIK